MKKLEMKIAPAPFMIPMAVNAVQDCARLYFTNEKDIVNIGLALEESIANITQHLAGNREFPIIITADGKDGDFTVTVTDRELPGNFDKVLTDEKAYGLTIMQNLMDEVNVEYLGKDGRCQTMTKHFKKDALLLHNFDFAEEDIESEAHKHTYTIRPPKEEEMLEIVRMIYREYGNSYDVEGAYNIEGYWQNILDDQAYYLVAVADNGEIAATLGVARMSRLPGIWDVGTAMCKERYRRGNLMKQLTEKILEYAKGREDISGVFTEATVLHPFSQRAFNHFGFKPVGFELSMLNDDQFQSKVNKHEGRASFANAMIIFSHDSKKVYIRLEQKNYVQKIVDSLDVERIISTDEQPFMHENCEFDEEYSKLMETGFTYFEKIGKDFDNVLRQIDFNVRKNGGVTNEIFINAEDPGAVYAQNAAVKNGYFCEQYIPCPDGKDYIVYARIYSNPVDYSEMITVSPFTEMLENVRNFDPDQNAFFHKEGKFLEEGSNCGEAVLVYHDHGGTLYLNEEVRDITDLAINNLNINRERHFYTDGNAPVPEAEFSVAESEMDAVNDFAFITIKRTGRDLRQQLTNLVKQLKKEKIRTIVAYLNLNEEAAAQGYEDVKSCGFFCTGLLPQAEAGDMLIMQNLLSTVIGYEEMNLTPDYQAMINEIRKLDPNEAYWKEKQV